MITVAVTIAALIFLAVLVALVWVAMRWSVSVFRYNASRKRLGLPVYPGVPLYRAFILGYILHMHGEHVEHDPH